MFDYDYDNNEILHELGIEQSEKEFQVHVLLRVDQMVDERMLTYVQTVLTDEQATEFNGINDRQEAQEYLQNTIPNLEETYHDELGKIVSDLKLALNA